MNEAEFVRYLVKAFPFTHGRGIGDDASVVIPGDGHQLISKDLLIETIHFKTDYFTPEELALRALAVNLSDIAAMGGDPQYFYLGLGVPARVNDMESMAFVRRFFHGLEGGCRRWGVELAGGDYSRSPVLVISVTVVGRSPSPVYRHTARTGDLVGITGATGESALGLKLLLEGERRGDLVDRHKIVEPRIEAGKRLAPYVSAMLDVSDGVLMDLGRILAASGKGARLHYEKFPVTARVRELCRQRGWDEHEAVLAGGEDYELLFTVSPENGARLRQEHPGDHSNYHIIGEITAEKGKLTVFNGDREINVSSPGYDHFS